MLKLKGLILHLVICVLSLGVIGSGIALSAKGKALKNYISIATNLKEENRYLEEKLRKIEVACSQLKNGNEQLRTEIKNLREPQLQETKSKRGEDKNQKIIGKLRNNLEQKEKECNTLYDLLQEAYSELLKEKFAALQPREDERRQRLTPGQREQFMMSRRDRTYEMMDRRIEQAPTDYEANLLQEMKERYANLFSLQDKLRTTSDEEREATRGKITDERGALSQLYNEYNSYQWESLGKEFEVKDIEEFVKQTQRLSQRRQFYWFGRWRPQRNRTQESRSR